MLLVFHFLEFLVTLHFCIKQTVFMDVVFILYFLMVRKLRNRCRMFPLQFSHFFIVSLFYCLFFPLTACLDRLIIFLVKMGFQIVFSIRNQFFYLILMFCLNFFCLFQFVPALCNSSFTFAFCKDTVSFYSVNIILQGKHPICPFFPETVYLFLDFPNIILNWLTKLLFFFSRENFTIFIRHIYSSPPL